MYTYAVSNAYAEVIGFMLLIYLLLLIRIRHTPGYGKGERWILKILFVGSLCALSDALCVLEVGQGNPAFFYIINVLFYIVYAYTVLLVFRYTLNIYFKFDQNLSLQHVLLVSPFLCIVIASIVSYWTGHVLYVDANCVYHRGDYYILYVGFGLLYIFGNMIAALIFFVRSPVKNRRSLEPLMYGIPLLLGPLIQVFYSGFPVTNMGITVTLLLICLNNQEKLLRREGESARLLATLAEEYDYVLLADLEQKKLRVLRSAPHMQQIYPINEELDYDETVLSMVKHYVVPDMQEELLSFFDRDAMKKFFEKNREYKIRYSVVPNKLDHYIYEMDLARIDEKQNRHLIVLGAKCIDDLIEVEREESLFNAALLHDCCFYYDFDVTDGILKTAPHSKVGYDPLFGEAVDFPISYDEFNEKRRSLLGIEADTIQEEKYWTCRGLGDAFSAGKHTLEMRYASEKLKRYWSATIILSADHNREHLHAVYISRDVTDLVAEEKENQRVLEVALEKARAASIAKSEFLSRMSHDIRTPLNGIIGILDINEKHSDDTAMVEENRKKARIAANHLLSLINDVLDMSKLEDGRIELAHDPVNIFSLFTDILTICNIRARDNGVTLTHDSGVNLLYPNVYGSELHIKQIMMNLMNNGIKYNKPGGSIDVSSFLVRFDAKTVTYCFVIKDTGIGMSEEFLAHIFEPFTQERNDARSRYQGTGMGMAIVKKLVDAMGGSIEVESQLGVGSTFSVVLTFDIDFEASSEATAEEESLPSVEGMRVLLVEDNDLNLDIAQCILEDMGVVVTTARDGLQACDTFYDNPPGSFDAILMDIMMPNLDGYGATEKIRGMDKADAQEIPIIAMTANAFADDVKKAKNAGMNEHLAKPLDIDRLEELLAKYRR